MNIPFPVLNLPEIDANILKKENKYYIYDNIRKKEIILTSEEWVRQHFISLLINSFNYPKSLIKLESELKYANKQKRTDIEVYKNNGEVFLLVECKSYLCKIDKNTLNQISIYNKVIKSNYIAVTNGYQHFIWEFTNEMGYRQINDFPVFNH